MMPSPKVIEIKKSARILRVVFDDGKEVNICFNRLRALSPAADGKPKTPPVNILVNTVEMVGNYAIKPVFSDGHQSGIYHWDLLYNAGDAAA